MIRDGEQVRIPGREVVAGAISIVWFEWSSAGMRGTAERRGTSVMRDDYFTNPGSGRTVRLRDRINIIHNWEIQ
ncbi:MAG: hypothetical protein NTV68_02470 [Methanomicrobiales archaeon]|nr:hypothetical protein [Methanomicrobiales archaeon]